MTKSILALILAAGIGGGVIHFLSNKEDKSSSAAIGSANQDSGKRAPRDTRISNPGAGKAPPNRLEEIRRTFPKVLTPDLAKKLKDDFFQRNPGVKERTDFSITLLGELCERGYSKEAWEMIDPNDGQLRSNELLAFFTKADFPASELLSRMADLEPIDVKNSFGGYLSRYSPDQLADVLTSGDTQSFLKGLSPAQTSSLQISWQVQFALMDRLGDNAVDNAAVLGAAASLNAKGLLDSGEYIALVNQEKSGDLFEKWDRVKAVDFNASTRKGELMQGRDKLISQMISKDPGQTLEQVLQSSKGVYADHDLKSAINHWSNVDPKGAGDWYYQNQSKLNPQQKNTVSSTFSSEAMNSLEFDTARSWAGEIQDAAMREKVLKKIEEKVTENQEAQLKKTQAGQK